MLLTVCVIHTHSCVYIHIYNIKQKLNTNSPRCENIIFNICQRIEKKREVYRDNINIKININNDVLHIAIYNDFNFINKILLSGEKLKIK